MADDVTLPGTGAAVETQQQPDGAHRQIIGLGQNDSAALIAVLQRLANPLWVDPTIAATRVQLQTGAATVGTVYIAANQNIGTVASVTSVSQIAGAAANSMVFDTMQASWAVSLRGRIT
jgi:hypothetical protein